MRKKILVLFCLCIILSLSGCKSKKEFNAYVASDLHYISKDICDFGPFFMRVLDAADGKVTEYEDEIVDCFIEDVIEGKPDVVILTGDLSFNGAKESHISLANKLMRIKEKGIPVLVLPGNHDVYMQRAAKFSGEEAEILPYSTSQDFYDAYYDLTYKDVYSLDDSSLTYTYKLNDKNWIVMIDANTVNNECAIRKETLSYIEEVLKEASLNKVKVTVAGHQNIFKHSNYDWGYVMVRNNELKKLFAKYNVNLFLSGHLHIQHYMEEDGIYEICSESLMMTPNQYGILKVKGDKFDYKTKELDIEGYAQKNNLQDENLLNFKDYAYNRIVYVNKLKFGERIEENTDDKDKLLDLIGLVNKMYFSGDLTKFDEVSAEFDEWIKTSSFVKSYVERIRQDSGNDYRSLAN